MKVCFGIISIIICVFIGYRLSRKFLEKRKFYQNFFDFNNNFKNEVAFRQRLLLDIVEEFNSKEEVFYLSVFKFFKFEEGKKEKIKFLSIEENEHFYKYLSVLGSGNKQTETDALFEEQKYLSDKLELAIKEEAKYKNLYIKIGFLLGLIIFIILL